MVFLFQIWRQSAEKVPLLRKGPHLTIASRNHSVWRPDQSRGRTRPVLLLDFNSGRHCAQLCQTVLGSGNDYDGFFGAFWDPSRNKSLETESLTLASSVVPWCFPSKTIQSCNLQRCTVLVIPPHERGIQFLYRRRIQSPSGSQIHEDPESYAFQSQSHPDNPDPAF